MISVKNSQLDKQTVDALNVLLELNLPAKIAFHLMRIVKELSSLVDDKIKLEKKILDRYMEKDENGNPIPATDEQGNVIPNAAKINNIQKFNSELEDLNAVETEIPFEKINFEDLQLQTVKVKDLIRLEFLFN
jgi:hypothetical protein